MAYNKQRSSGFKNGRPLGGDKQFTPGKAQGRTDRQGGKRSEEAGGPPYQRADGSGIGAPRQDRRPPREDRPGRPAEEFRAAPIPAPAGARGARRASPDPLWPQSRPGAIKSGRSIDKLLVTAAGSEDGSLREIVRMARERNIIVSEVARQKLGRALPALWLRRQERQPPGRGGAGARVPVCGAGRYPGRSPGEGAAPFVLVLDSINDPHNLGSIIRSAECAGVHGVIIPKRRAASVTGAVAKASAGAVAYMPIAPGAQSDRRCGASQEGGTVGVRRGYGGNPHDPGPLVRPSGAGDRRGG